MNEMYIYFFLTSHLVRRFSHPDSLYIKSKFAQHVSACTFIISNQFSLKLFVIRLYMQNKLAKRKVTCFLNICLYSNEYMPIYIKLQNNLTLYIIFKREYLEIFYFALACIHYCTDIY
jgi:hypothetical protein